MSWASIQCLFLRHVSNVYDYNTITFRHSTLFPSFCPASIPMISLLRIRHLLNDLPNGCISRSRCPEEWRRRALQMSIDLTLEKTRRLEWRAHLRRERQSSKCVQFFFFLPWPTIERSEMWDEAIRAQIGGEKKNFNHLERQAKKISSLLTLVIFFTCRRAAHASTTKKNRTQFVQELIDNHEQDGTISPLPTHRGEERFSFLLSPLFPSLNLTIV